MPLSQAGPIVERNLFRNIHYRGWPADIRRGSGQCSGIASLDVQTVDGEHGFAGEGNKRSFRRRLYDSNPYHIEYAASSVRVIPRASVAIASSLRLRWKWAQMLPETMRRG